jgi:hypothetical protein
VPCRYAEVILEGKDDEEQLELIRTEHLKRQLALFTSQDLIRQQASDWRGQREKGLKEAKLVQ